MLLVVQYFAKSLKVIRNDNGTIWKLEFAFHSNYGRILYHFRYKPICWSKIAFFSHRPIPAFDAPIRGSPSEYYHNVWCEKLEWWKKFNDRPMFSRFDTTLTTCDRRTDRRTDISRQHSLRYKYCPAEKIWTDADMDSTSCTHVYKK